MAQRSNSYRFGTSPTQQANDQFRAQRLYSDLTQTAESRRQTYLALLQMQQQAEAQGIPRGALPVISERMSPVDMQAAGQRYTRLLGGSSTAPMRTPTYTPPQEAQNGSMNDIGGVSTGVFAGLTPPASVPTVQPDRVIPSIPAAGQNVASVMRPDGTQATNFDGTPRFMGYQPPLATALEAKFPGFATMTDEQKRATLRANPGNPNVGTTTAAPAFDWRGNRTVEQTGVTQDGQGGAWKGLEYDPRKDALFQPQAMPDGSRVLTSKYGTGSITPGVITGDPVAPVQPAPVQPAQPTVAPQTQNMVTGWFPGKAPTSPVGVQPPVAAKPLPYALTGQKLGMGDLKYGDALATQNAALAQQRGDQMVAGLTPKPLLKQGFNWMANQLGPYSDSTPATPNAFAGLGELRKADNEAVQAQYTPPKPPQLPSPVAELKKRKPQLGAFIQ